MTNIYKIVRLNLAYGCLSVHIVIVFLTDIYVMGNRIVGMEKMKLDAQNILALKCLNASCL